MLDDSKSILYEASSLSFNGSNYIDTGVYLFSEENIDKDFEMVVTDSNFVDSGTNPNTLICHKKNNNSYGFLVRSSTKPTNTYKGTLYTQPNTNNNYVVKRVNGVLSFSGDIVNNPGFLNNVHNQPLTLGCALQDSGAPYRYATGTIGHIVVRWI